MSHDCTEGSNVQLVEVKFSAYQLGIQVIAGSENLTSERLSLKSSHESFAFGLG